MAYSPGDEVHVETFGKGVVREVRNRGRYLVEVKSRLMVVNGSQLAAIGSSKGRTAAENTGGSSLADRLARGHAPASLDLHGMTVEEALTALDVFLDDAIRAGLPEVQVIHGRSGGRLKAAVHGRLQALPPVRGFRLDPRNPGVTIVSL